MIESARLGVDIGGTFTDLVVVDESSGRLRLGKILTTPKDPAHAVEAGVAHLLAEARIPATRVRAVAPLIVEQKALRPDSAGAGCHRGGLGQVIAFRVRTNEPFYCSILCDRTRHAAQGFFGGEAGALGELLIDGQAPPNPKAEHAVPPGGLVEVRLPGGGRYGRPDERDPELVARDRLEGYVTR